MKAGKSIEISATAERVWPFLVEPEKILQWCITYRKFEYTSEQRSGVGTPVYLEEQGGSLMKIHFEATEWKENEKLAWRMVSGTGVKSYQQFFSLEPTPSGCRFTFKEEIELPGGIFGKLIGIIAEQMSKATLDKMMLKLKALVEV